jgi:hypothetical protein
LYKEKKLKESIKKNLPLSVAILPLVFLVTLLSFNLYANVFIYDADPLAGSSPVYFDS